MGNSFGVSGLRGEANVSLTADITYKFGKLLGWYLRKLGTRESQAGRPKVVIGRDPRQSGALFESSISAGLMESGADAYLLHVTSTPSVSFITRHDKFDCGVMITASHNPFYDNGIKVIDQNGVSMGEKLFFLLEDYVNGHLECFGRHWDEIPAADRNNIGTVHDWSYGRETYIQHLASITQNSLNGIRVGLDCANGASSVIAHKVFEALGVEAVFINDKPDGFNINQNCGSEHLDVIRKLVLDNKLDVGFSLDGDADRCMALDSEGNEVNGDHFSYIYAKFLKERGRLANNAVVGTIVSNLALKMALEKEGIDYYICGVGEPVVRQCMAEHGSIIGGEQCGHMVFAEHSNTGDGLLTAIKMLDVMKTENKSLKELASPLVELPQHHVYLKVTDKKAAVKDPKLLEVVDRIQTELGSMGRVLVRHSDTESVVRVMVESESWDKCYSYADQIVDALRSKGYLV